MNIHTIIFILWVFVFGFMCYKRTPSNSIIVFCTLVISFILIQSRLKKEETRKLPHILENNTMLEWLTSFINATDDDEKHRCYYEIRNMLYSDALQGNNNDHNIVIGYIGKV